MYKDLAIWQNSQFLASFGVNHFIGNLSVYIENIVTLFGRFFKIITLPVHCKCFHLALQYVNPNRTGGGCRPPPSCFLSAAAKWLIEAIKLKLADILHLLFSNLYLN